MKTTLKLAAILLSASGAAAVCLWVLELNWGAAGVLVIIPVVWLWVRFLAWVLVC